MMPTTTTLESLATKFNKERYNSLSQTMSMMDYIETVLNRPSLAYAAYQRLYSMINEAGVTEYQKFQRTVRRYNFFDDESIPIYGLDSSLESLVKHIRGAAYYHGPERRILLMHGPVGSSKSTICRRIKRGLENYSRTDPGAVFTFDWVNIGEFDTRSEAPCPLNDDPLKLIPEELRPELVNRIQSRMEETAPDKERNFMFPIRLQGDLNPHCKYFFNELMKKYNGDLFKVLEKHIRVRRILLSEADRLGIGTFQPKDPKNQDATELTGDINYLKLGVYGSDSDPRAFNFDGEFEIANRGLLEFIEVLKLEREFLYDLLGACQERQIKPKKFPQVDIDMVLIGHTNNPEFEELRANQKMEALRDRTVRVDIPYLTEWSKEISVLRQDFNPAKCKKHIAPHTIEIAALWDVMTRLHFDPSMEVSLVQKAKLYDGRSMPNWTEHKVKELLDRNAKHDEGLKIGISARYTQNAISNALVTEDYLNPFVVLAELELKLGMLMTNNKEQIAHYKTCIELARKELDEILKEEVQKAIVGDESVMERVFANYIDNVVAHCDRSKLRNPITGVEQDPDEKLMRSIEEMIEVPENNADEFRRQAVQFMATMNHRKRSIKWDTDPKLAEAIRKKVFQDMKDHIKISQLSNITSANNKDLQGKIDAIRQRMVDNYGYTEKSAQDVLSYVSGLFSRGELADS